MPNPCTICFEGFCIGNHCLQCDKKIPKNRNFCDLACKLKYEGDDELEDDSEETYLKFSKSKKVKAE